MSEIPGELPVRRFGGERPGPRLLVTAGVHGDEYLPMLVVRELIRRFEADPGWAGALRGTLTLVPLVNEPAFRLGRRCGEDGLDLARTCPGRADGLATERIAHAVSTLIRESDAYIDLHTGGTELAVFPMAGYVLHRDSGILERQRAMARAFNLPVVWGTSAELPGRTLSVARDAGVPAIYVEYFGATRERQEIASGTVAEHPCVAGVLGVMPHLGLLPGSVREDRVEEVIEDWRPDSGHMQICHPAPETGFLRTCVALGARVRQGEVLAEVEPLSDGPNRSIPADRSGRVLVLRDFPRVNAGEAVAVIAEHHAPS